MARDVQDWRGYPVLLNVVFHPDRKGKFFSMIKYGDKTGGGKLDEKKDGRNLWFKQIKKDGDEDLENLLEDL